MSFAEVFHGNRLMRGAIGAFGTICVIGVGPLGAQDVWATADSAVVRLSPSVFPGLSAEHRMELVDRGCLVPQADWVYRSMHNVVRGEFAAVGQVDWAVLCSRDHESMILVFWGGPARCLGEFSRSSDRAWLQVVGNEQIGFSRYLSTITAARILAIQYAYDRDSPPDEIRHDGLEESFLEKASTIHYCQEGQWVEIAGAD